jgi:hypothetical protein
MAQTGNQAGVIPHYPRSRVKVAKYLYTSNLSPQQKFWQENFTFLRIRKGLYKEDIGAYVCDPCLSVSSARTCLIVI